MKEKQSKYNIETAKKELEKYRITNKYNVEDEDLDFDLKKVAVSKRNNAKK